MIPTRIHLHKKTQRLAIDFNQEQFSLDAEFLRVHSPSAEVQGHGGHGGELPVQKRDVKIQKIEPVGNYAIRLYFDDGHTSGLYTWSYLHKLGTNKGTLWAEYLKKIKAAGQTREKGAQVLTFSPNP